MRNLNISIGPPSSRYPSPTAQNGHQNEMLTGTWLESAKLLAGLFFLLLLLLLLPPPELIVLPPDIFRFLRLLGACLAGSAGERTEGNI